MIATFLQVGLSNALIATALAALAFVVTRRMRPRWAVAVWLLVLIKLLMPPLWTPSLGSVYAILPSTANSPDFAWIGELQATEPAPPPSNPRARLVTQHRTAPAFIPSTTNETIAATLSTIAPWLTSAVFLLWIAGTAALAALSLHRIRRFRTFLGRARRAPASLQYEVQTLAATLNLKHAPDVRIAGRRMAPLAWALFDRPTVLLPAGLLRKLTRPQRTALLLHELAHLRRRDHWTKLVDLVAVAIYWWLPTAWWARSQAQQAAEHCCDAIVVAHAPSAARAYAEALLATIDFLADTPDALPCGASGFSQFGHVSRRIEMILESRTGRRQSLPLCMAMTALVVLALPLSVQPLWAEPPIAAHDDTNSAAPEDTAEKTEPPVAPLATASEAFDDADDRRAARERQLTRNNVRRRLDKIIAEAEASLDLAESHFNRRLAAQRDVDAYQRAFEKGLVALDQVMESQRRLVEAEMIYVREVCKLCPDAGRGKLLQAEACLHIASEAVERSLLTWAKIHQQLRAHSTIAWRQREQQAREQYYFFKQQSQRALCEYLELAADSDQATDAQAAPTKCEVATITISGPPTVPNQEGPLDPPSDEAILRALDHQRAAAADSTPSPRQSIRIVKEKISTYADAPRAYPLLGLAKLHHALYKCTIYSQTPDGQEREDVIHVDHRNFQQLQRQASGNDRAVSPN